MQQFALVDMFGNIHIQNIVDEIIMSVFAMGIVAGIELARQVREERVVVAFEEIVDSDLSYNLPVEVWYRKIQKIKYVPTFENKIRIRES